MAEDLIQLKLDTRETKTDIKYIKEELHKTAKRNAVEHDDIKDTLDKYLEKIEKEKASIWVEKAMLYLALAVAGTIIASIMKLVLL